MTLFGSNEAEVEAAKAMMIPWFLGMRSDVENRHTVSGASVVCGRARESAIFLDPRHLIGLVLNKLFLKYNEYLLWWRF
jgi:hypothetical protein